MEVQAFFVGLKYEGGIREDIHRCFQIVELLALSDMQKRGAVEHFSLNHSSRRAQLTFEAFCMAARLEITALINQNAIEFELGGIRYVGFPTRPNDWRLPHSEEALLFTVLTVPSHVSTDTDWLAGLIDNIRSSDDVFQPSFLDGVVIQTHKLVQRERIPVWNEILRSYGASWVICPFGDVKIQAGLYLWHQGKSWHAFRLHEDPNGAFMTALHPEPDAAGFRPLSIGGDRYQTLSVAVPSRVRSLCSDDKLKLDGLRVVVKDCWRMKGLRNTLENRAYYELDDPATETSYIIKKLCNNGATILGMTKLSNFVGREEPSESVDYQLPFNPRGDGYQSPAGSSNGSAAAVAAYDWVDVGIGTDTTGSVRRPAFVNGCFGLRPSQDLASQNGLITTFKRFDTASLLSKDLEVLRNVASVLLEDSPNSLHTRKPPRLLWPQDYLPVADERQQRMIDSFVRDMEKELKVKHEKISIRDTWTTSPPSGSKLATVEELMVDVATNTFLYSFYHSFDNFRQDYEAKKGKRPYVPAFTQRRWDLAKSISPSIHQDALDRLDIYREWFIDTVMDVNSHNTFIILPIADAKPQYRDDPPPSFFEQNAFDALFLAPILKAPELIVPIGQVSYESRISGVQEQLPVALSVLGDPHSDLDLMDMVSRCLKTAGRPQKVECGRVMFS